MKATVTEVESFLLRVSFEGLSVRIGITGHDQSGNALWNYGDFDQDMGRVISRDEAIRRAAQWIAAVSRNHPTCAECRTRHPGSIGCGESWDLELDIPF
jgi:hypothetical protein